MIRQLNITDPTATHIAWWEKVPALSKPRTFKFTPGLNILWGANGSGKSTVLKGLARALHCEQSGRPVVTETSLSDLSHRWQFKINQAKGGLSNLPSVFEIDHDGQGVRFFDPSAAVGLMGGGYAFDWDFGNEGITNNMFRGSAGQTTLFRAEQMLKSVFDGITPKVERRIKADKVNDVWKEYCNVADILLKGSGKKGPPTILLDEPERSFDLPNQISIWRFIRAYSKRIQFIVASHCIFALRLPEANYIELSTGYLEVCTRALGLFEKWPEEKPTVKPSPAPLPGE